MTQSRRRFLEMAASVVAVSACSAGLLAAQVQRPGPPLPRVGGNPFPNGPLDQIPMPEPPKRSAEQQLKLNRADIEKDMMRLKTAVVDLEKEFESNDTTSVFSISAVRKTEEIEKLARHIRGLVRG